MSTLETSRFCGICKKIFCCAQCRKRHEKKKHPDRQLNCPFCTSQKLPLQNFEDKSLLCHIVINHLPLYCCLCGETFRQSKDLEAFSACKWWQSRRRHSLITEPKSLLETPPSLPDAKRTEKSIEREYNGKFVTLTSPPELYRNTSTPMVVGQKTNFDFKTPNVPNFSLKTPRTDSAASTKGHQARGGLQMSTLELKDGNSDGNFVSFSTSSSCHEETPFRSLPSNRAGKDDHSARNNSGRKRDIMKGKDGGSEKDTTRYEGDNHCIEDMELTGVEGEVLPDTQSLEMLCEKPERRSDSIKKVRFSDQYECQPEPSTTSVFNMTENEEYFEARESLSGLGDPMENSQTRIYQENKKNTEKENQSPDGVNVILNQQPTGSSRVVMMVVMENNSGLTTSDLTPLIDSGLKKLERVTSAGSYPSITNLSGRNSPGCSGSSMTSMDSYYSVSSYECYSTASSTSSSSFREPSSPIETKENASTGGIFSAVAHAVRSVMKNFSGAGPSRSLAREQTPRENVVTTTGNVDTSLNLTSSLRRPGKRPRDVSESASSSSRHVDFVVPQVEARSPVAKRHRGWYKIKAREPIARMRNNRVTSPRGISSETQVFSQGSLSVGDTVLPLPVRAHQSTQTE